MALGINLHISLVYQTRGEMQATKLDEKGMLRLLDYDEIVAVI